MSIYHQYLQKTVTVDGCHTFDINAFDISKYWFRIAKYYITLIIDLPK